MTLQKDQAEDPRDNAWDITKKFAGLGARGAVKEFGDLDELSRFIDRGEVQPFGNVGSIQLVTSAPDAHEG